MVPSDNIILRESAPEECHTYHQHSNGGFCPSHGVDALILEEGEALLLMQHEPGPSGRGQVGNVVLLADVQNQLQPWDTRQNTQTGTVLEGEALGKKGVYFLLPVPWEEPGSGCRGSLTCAGTLLVVNAQMAIAGNSQVLPQIFQITRGRPSATCITPVVTFFV